MSSPTDPLPKQSTYRVFRSPSNPNVFRLHDPLHSVSWIYCCGTAEAAEDFLAGIKAGQPRPAPDAVAFERR